jgi:hypothetical protein
MPKSTTVLKKRIRVRRGEKVTKGPGWKLMAPGVERAFRGTLLEVVYVGRARVGVFRVN